MARQYLFTSQRLGFRNWRDEDIPLMAAINADPAVMEYFPSTQTAEQTRSFIERMQKQFAEKVFCYFAVDVLETSAFIGFIGLSEQTYDASFTPCVDIGWRLSSAHWGRGYATEGAQQCLDYAFTSISLKKVVAVAPQINLKSIEVMKKAGMEKVADFIHPLLQDNERLRDCVLYEASNLRS